MLPQDRRIQLRNPDLRLGTSIHFCKHSGSIMNKYRVYELYEYEYTLNLCSKMVGMILLPP